MGDMLKLGIVGEKILMKAYNVINEILAIFALLIESSIENPSLKWIKEDNTK